MRIVEINSQKRMKIAATGKDYVHSCRVHNTGNEAGSHSLNDPTLWIWFLAAYAVKFM